VIKLIVLFVLFFCQFIPAGEIDFTVIGKCSRASVYQIRDLACRNSTEHVAVYSASDHPDNLGALGHVVVGQYERLSGVNHNSKLMLIGMERNFHLMADVIIVQVKLIMDNCNGRATNIEHLDFETIGPQSTAEKLNAWHEDASFRTNKRLVSVIGSDQGTAGKKQRHYQPQQASGANAQLPPCPISCVTGRVRSLPLSAKIVVAGISTIAAWLMLFRGIDWFDGFGFTRRNRGRGLAYIAIGFLLFCLSGWLCWLSRPY
jgi:hypothetical protein